MVVVGVWCNVYARQHNSCSESIQGRCASEKYCRIDHLQGENWKYERKFYGLKILDVELHYFLFYESI